MNFTVIVNAHPTSITAQSALKFCQTLIDTGLEIYRLFFYGEGVLNGIDNFDQKTSGQWRQFITQNKLDAICCVNSATEHVQDSASNFLDGFSVSGIGQLVDGLVNSDRVITFGNRAAT